MRAIATEVVAWSVRVSVCWFGYSCIPDSSNSRDTWNVGRNLAIVTYQSLYPRHLSSCTRHPSFSAVDSPLSPSTTASLFHSLSQILPALVSIPLSRPTYGLLLLLLLLLPGTCRNLVPTSLYHRLLSSCTSRLSSLRLFTTLAIHNSASLLGCGPVSPRSRDEWNVGRNWRRSSSKSHNQLTFDLYVYMRMESEP